MNKETRPQCGRVAAWSRGLACGAFAAPMMHAAEAANQAPSPMPPPFTFRQYSIRFRISRSNPNRPGS